MTERFEDWPQKTKILIILAHPDDPEFFLGGTIARWTQAGHTVQYVLLTKGEKGTSPEYPDPQQLAAIRQSEQKAAAAVLGVTQVEILDYSDGYLTPDLEKRKVVTRLIRKAKPDVVVSCDPQSYYIGNTYLNHPDHRAAGQIVVDAVFPATGNRSFFPELIEEGFPAHRVAELWLSLPNLPNVEVDVSEQWEKRTEALLRHKSQIGNPETFTKQMQDRRAENGGSMGEYIERFRRIIF
ncbi:MAG: PIG-L deacetylase family protein [Anaerolineaceae bacterium]